MQRVTYLFFIDADAIVPDTLLQAIHATMSDLSCVGGGVDYRPQRLFIRLYLRAWKVLGRLTGMAPRSHAILPEVCLRGSRRLRREGLDRGGR